jgi:regulatory protein
VLRKRRPRTAPDEQAGSAAAAFAAAVACLSRRDFCGAELGARLTQQGFSDEAVQAALADLAARRYLDDTRYAQQFVAAHAARGQGPLRIRRDLLACGLAAALAEAALQEHAGEQGGWAQLARAARERRFGAAPPPDRREAARQARFLQYRGFSNDHIRLVLGDDVSADAD